MFLGKKPTRLAPSAKSRLNTHTQRLESVDSSRKKSPDGPNPNPPGPPSPTEVLVFNTHHGGSTRAGHYNRSLPEVPNIEEIHKFMKDSWDERIARINEPGNNLNVLWIKTFAEEEREKEEAAKAAAAAAVGSEASSPTTESPAVAGATAASSSNSRSSPASASASSSSSSTPTTSSSSSTKFKNFNNSPQHNSKKNSHKE